MADLDTLQILLLAHGLPPESVGGVEQHVEGLARALLALGQRVEIYAKTARPGAQGTTLAEGGWPFPVTRVVYRYEGLDTLHSLYARPLLDGALRAFLAGRRFDLAHVHHFTGMSTGLVEVLHAHRIPVVVTLHDYWLLCPRGQMWHRDGTRCATVEPRRCADCLAPAFGGFLPESSRVQTVAALHRHAREVLERADALVAPSARVVPPFAAAGIDPSRIRVVENGVDTAALESLPPPCRAPGAPLRIGYLGTLIPSKGLEVLVDAFQRLPRGSATLDLHGNAAPYHGDASLLTRVFARLRPGDAVTYHGPYASGELPRILAGLDVVVAPALWEEAFGLTVREAQAAGRAVVVSRVGGLQDALADGVEGFVVEPGDADALAAALRRLADDPALAARLGAAGRARCRGFLPMARALLEIYRDVAAGGPERSLDGAKPPP